MRGRHGVWPALFALIFGCSACSRDKETSASAPAKGAAANASAAPLGAASPPPGTPPRPAGPTLTEASVRELVQKWTAAQSGNDFAGYEALYAERFTGIKRAGTFVKRLGRADWMADRRTMIAPGLIVEASDVKVDVTPTAANVHFVQRYKSPRFEDVGPKQLVVVLTPQGPRIAREEMLSSMIQMQGLGKPLASRLHAAESTGVFLVSGLGKGAGKGDPVVAKPEYLGVQEADAAVNEAALAPEQRAFVGRAFTAYDAAGKPCPAVVKSLSIKAVVIPHFGVLQSFEDRAEYPDPAAAEKAKPGVFYDLAGNEGRYLFGRFESPCPGARWAVEGSGVAVVPKSEPLKEHPGALAALRALPEYKKVQAELAAEHPEKKAQPWDTYDGETSFDAFRPPKGAPLLVASSRAGNGCGDFYGALAAVFDSTDPAHPASRGVIDGAPGILNVLAAVDLDGDGELEFVTGPDGESERFGLIRPGKKGTYVREDFFAVPFLDCPC